MTGRPSMARGGRWRAQPPSKRAPRPRNGSDRASFAYESVAEIARVQAVNALGAQSNTRYDRPMADVLVGRRILLGVTGSIAAYKAAELTRLLVKRGGDVQVVLTEAASRFVTALTFG